MVDNPPVEPADTAGSRPERGWLRDFAFYLSAIATALFMVRLLGAGWSTRFPAIWPDAVFPKEGYLAVAAKSPFRPSFYFAFRPIGYPFLLWVLGRRSLLTVVAQTFIYCAAVIALCAAAVRVLRSRVVGVVTAVLIVGIAVQAKYAMWNTQILSESLAISLGFVTLAAWWRFAAAPDARSRAVGVGVPDRVPLGTRRTRVTRDDRGGSRDGRGRLVRHVTRPLGAALVGRGRRHRDRHGRLLVRGHERLTPRRAVVPQRRRRPHPPRPPAHEVVREPRWHAVERRAPGPIRQERPR